MAREWKELVLLGKRIDVKNQKEGIFINLDSFSNSLNLFWVILHSGLGVFCMLGIFISEVVREHSTPSAGSYIISVTSSTVIPSLGRGDYGCPKMAN